MGSEKYAYKLRWFQRFREFLETRFKPTDPVIVCGDFNVARDEKDVARPDAWAGTVLFHPEVRQTMEHVLSWGLVDVLRTQHPEGGLYSWWDYRMLAFPKNDGLRLDYVLATEPLAGRCISADIDREERKGEKPSDHAPVMSRSVVDSSSATIGRKVDGIVPRQAVPTDTRLQDRLLRWAQQPEA